MNTQQITTIRVYWDEQVPDDHCWSYRVYIQDETAQYGEREIESGRVEIDPTASLSDAVAEACYEIGIELTPDQFAYETEDGGHAMWTRLDDGER